MPTFTRGGIARGVKLAIQNVFTPLSSIASSLTAATLGKDNMAEKAAPFRMNFHIPNLPFWAFRPVAATVTEAFNSGVPIPFALPLPQQFWSGTTPTDAGANPEIFLDEIQFSFDQGDEGAAPQIDTNGIDGRLSKPGAQYLNVRLSILEHSPTVLGNTSLKPDGDVFTMDIPALALQSDFIRSNPLVRTGLRKPMSPSKCYVLIIDAPELYEAATAASPLYLSLPAVTISLKFSCELMSRDVSTIGFPMQNMPSHLGIPQTHSVTVTAPAADATIAATGNTGVQTNMVALDDVAQRGIAGSYERDGALQQYEEQDYTAAYEVIAVPMMQNMTELGAVTYENAADCNFVGAAPLVLPLCDRRIVPLAYPITIHHVVAGLNWQNAGRNAIGAFTAFSSTGSVGEPALNRQTWKCGVGLLSGIRSDLTATTQVAYRSTTCDVWTGTIDRIDWRDGTNPVRIMSVPLVGPVAPTGAGFFAQGFPMWASRGTSRSTTRTSVYNTAGAIVAPPPTQGCEQALEVRMSLEDSVGLEANAYTYAGQGGHWVFIYGKKHLATTKNQIVR